MNSGLVKSDDLTKKLDSFYDPKAMELFSIKVTTENKFAVWYFPEAPAETLALKDDWIQKRKYISI